MLEQFAFCECLSTNVQAKLPEAFIINEKTNEEALIIRQFLGLLKVQNNINNLKFRNLNNFSKSDYILNKRLSFKIFSEFEKDYEFTIQELNNYIIRSKHFGNKQLFRNFLLECTNFFYQKSKGNHTTAFLHLYRALELISYTFPLVYTSRSRNFHGTFIELKEFFNKTESERQFLRKFVSQHLFKDEPSILDIRVQLLINAPHTHLQRQYFDVLMKICKRNNNIEILDNNPNSEIVTNKKSLISLMIDIRNRNFHLLTGDYNENVSCSDLYEIDNFFGNLNDVFCNWIALIYFKILESSVRRNIEFV
jgi:hypothetical protein